jgi:hypothetical protein
MSLSRVLSALVCSVVGVQLCAAQGPVIEVRPVRIGDTAVTGVVVPAPMSAAGYYIEIRTLPGGTFQDRRAVTSIDATTGVFTVTLAAPLAPRQSVIAGRTDGNVTSRPVATLAFTATPSLRPLLFDGGRIVRGYIEDRAGVAAVQVMVLRSALENELGKDYLQVKSTSEIASDGQFEITLPQPLVAGQIVVARALTSGGVFATAMSDRVTVTDPGSWGRARAYFAGGVIFSKDRSQFSQQDIAMTFAVDKSWIQKPDFRLPADVAVREALRLSSTDEITDGTTRDEKERIARGTGKVSWRGLNTFFDTRLTALPLVQTAAATPAAGTQAAKPAEQFVASRKGALMQVGVYLPFYGPQTSWVYDGAVNTFFIAPLFRGGIQTINGADGEQTVNQDGEPDDVYHYMAGGVAIGHQKLSGTTNQTPEIISYLHFAWGKSEAFKYKKAGSETTLNPWRMMVEGRLKIPYSAMQIGFDANLGEGRDDVRFVFGTRFDIGEAISRVAGFQQ